MNMMSNRTSRVRPTSPALSAPLTAFLARDHGLLIGGGWRAGAGGRQTVHDPATGRALCDIDLGSAEDVDAAVAAARKALPGWASRRPEDRSAVIVALATLIDENLDLLAEAETLDNGMPIFAARYTIAGAADLLRYYARLGESVEGTTYRTTSPAGGDDALTYTLREPVGVAALIVPWNVPFTMACLKLAPALAAGCAVVLKPAELTPLSALILGDLVIAAGLPPGVVNIVNGLGAVAGAALASHMDVDKVAFTGSTAVGRQVIAATAASNLKRVSLELGGKSAVLVLDDADLDLVIPGVGMAAFALQGQNCMAGTRLLLHENVAGRVLDGLYAYCDRLVLGHGLDPLVTFGPLVDRRQSERVQRYVDIGVEEGATLARAGGALDGPGAFFEPVIFTDVQPHMRIAREEIFGPVLTVQTFGDEDVDSLAARANDSDYGLSGSVWTRDLSRAHKLVQRIRSGQVSINCHAAMGQNIPFGGYKQSGWGREFGREGLDLYLETKAVTARL